MIELLRDLQTACRSLRRSPGFSLVAVVMMGVAIAATTATYGVVDAILLRPLPYHQPDRLVQLWESNPDKGWTHQSAAPANVLDWRERATSFVDIAFYNFFEGGRVVLDGQSDPLALSTAYVSGNLFSVLGVEPAAGRFFEWNETWDGGGDPVVISHDLWRNRFASDPGVVGRALRIDGAPVTVVGIAPRGFRLHDVDPDLWATIDFDPQARSQDWFRRAHFVTPIARLADGVDVETARSELRDLAARLEQEHPVLNRNMGAGLTPLHEWVVSDARRALWILLAAVLSVLLVACVNLAHLLLARATDRRDELETRRALGATGARLMAPIVLESLLLGGSACIAGIAGACALVHLARTHGPADVPRLWEATVDVRTLAVALGLGLLTSVICSGAPARAALRASRVSPNAPARVGGSQREHRTHRSLVAAEVALAMILLVCAGAFLRSLVRIVSIDAGFEPRELVAVTVQLPAQGYAEARRRVQFFDALQDRLAALPGVRSAGLIDALPIAMTTWTTGLSIEGRGEEGFVPEIQHRTTGPGYFRTMAVELIAGRDFLDGDEDLPAVILNRTTVERHFEGSDPIGTRVKMARPGEDGIWMTVIGVVEDEKQNDLRADVIPQMYVPFRSSERVQLRPPGRLATIVLRTSSPPATLAGPVRDAVRAIDDSVPLRGIESMGAVIHDSLARELFVARLLGGLSGTALLLAAIGIYGVLAHWVSRRRREMGIRQALGADSRALARLVVGQSMGAVVAGATIGLLGAAVAGRPLRALLYQVSPTEPVALAGLTALVLVIGLLASSLPLRRALRIDPQQALRAD
ncbi:MAG TPA: ABC transporter permease [Thermoanaerobaculia bacterium]|nr:ABC transporter permease [Thermoanaerobaculia bacterium]